MLCCGIQDCGFFHISPESIDILLQQDTNWLYLNCKLFLAQSGWKLKSQFRSSILGELLAVCHMQVLFRGRPWAEFIHRNLGSPSQALSFLGFLSHFLEALLTWGSIPRLLRTEQWLTFCESLAAHSMLHLQLPLEASYKKAGNLLQAGHLFQILISLPNLLLFVHSAELSGSQFLYFVIWWEFQSVRSLFLSTRRETFPYLKLPSHVLRRNAKYALAHHYTFIGEGVKVLLPTVVAMPQLANLVTVFLGLFLKARMTVNKLGMILS